MATKNPKEKGNKFERIAAGKLSLWISGGEDKNILWRSDSSGARATRSDAQLKNQAGDLKADSKRGWDFIDLFYVECKHYKDIGIDQLIWQSNKQDNCYGWWQKYTKKAKELNQELMLICRQNNRKDLLLVSSKFLKIFEVDNKHVIMRVNNLDCNVLYLDIFTYFYDFEVALL